MVISAYWTEISPTSGALLFVACHILVLLSRFFFCAFHVPSCKGALRRYKISYFLALDVKSSLRCAINDLVSACYKKVLNITGEKHAKICFRYVSPFV
jgi:hypothetical protein